MEVSLRKPQRQIFNKMRQNHGSYVRSYRKSCSATRLYYRLMTHDHSPLQNITPGNMKPFFQLSLMEETGGGYKLKDDILLIEKKNKVKEPKQ